MHGSGTSHIEHLSIGFSIIIFMGAIWYNHLIKFKAFCQMGRSDDYTTAKSNTPRIQQVYCIFIFQRMVKIISLFLGFANNTQ